MAIPAKRIASCMDATRMQAKRSRSFPPSSRPTAILFLLKIAAFRYKKIEKVHPE